MKVLTGVLAVILLAGCSSSPERSSEPVEVGYFVTGSARAVSITLSDGEGGTQQASNRSVPLTSSSDTPGLHFRMMPGSFAYISAQNEDEAGTVKCAISINGVTVKTATSTGAYTIASCSTSIP